MAGPANNTTTQTHWDASIPEVWANKVLKYLKKRINLVNTVTLDFDDEGTNQYGDTINITDLGTLTAKDKEKGKDVELQQPSDSQTQVILNNHKEITFSPEDVARIFQKPKKFEMYTEKAAAVLMEAIETSLVAEYANAGNSHDAGSAVDLADLRSARRILVSNSVPQGDPIYGYLDEYAIEDLPLTDASTLGVAAPVIDGSIAKLGGVNIFETNMISATGSPATYHDMVYHKDAIALVVRPLPTDAESFGGARQGVVSDERAGVSLRVTMSYNPNALAPQVTVDTLWGVKTVRSELLVDLYHTNA